MRFPISIHVLALGALTLAPVAQETATPPLQVRSNDPMVVGGMLMMFPDAAERPAMELAEGEVFLLTLGADRKVDVQRTQGSGWLEVSAQPGALMQIFEKELARYRQMAQALGGMALAQQGADFEEIQKIADALFEFPNQIDRIDLSVRENPETTRSLDLDLLIAPREDTWLGQTLADLRPDPAGVHKLPGDDALMTAAVSVDFARVSPHVTPIMDEIYGMVFQDEEQRATSVAVLNEFYGSITGNGWLTVDPSGAMTWLGGLSEPAKTRELLHSERYAEVLAISSEMNEYADVRIDMQAFTHREVPVMAQTIAVDTGMVRSEGGPDGTTMTSYYAVAGNYLVVEQLGAAEESLKSTIDAVLDSKLETVKLGANVLLTADVKVVEVVTAIMATQGGFLSPDETEEMPANAHIEITKLDQGLRIEVKAK